MEILMQFRQVNNESAKGRLKDYAAKKLTRLDRHLPEASIVELTLEEQKQNHIAKALIDTPYGTFRGEENAETLAAAIDILVDTLERQLLKFKERNLAKREKEVIKHPPTPPLIPPEEEATPTNE
jgi:putative sigma-54 modulation protein